MFTALQSLYQLRTYKLHKFKSKINLNIEVGPFVLKTVDSAEELREALSLRWEVFHTEMLGKKSGRLDMDDYDYDCDHLVIKEKRTDKVIGTYRIRCSLHTNNFYSANEFNINTLLQQPGVKIELGRACIAKEFRRGAVISMLWRGIAEYMNATDAKILFGCATVTTENPQEAALLQAYFENEGRVAEVFQVRPTADYSMPNLREAKAQYQDSLSEAQREQAEELMPPLCRAYLKIGAYIGGEPAWDRDYRCVDFLTILQREDLNSALWKRFKMGS
ncbi:GNAT family N-acetyltransferase [Bdellovibrio sp. HCB274]|uniref:GNAT family N-acetyltransferase n=1 Tax=Bdellovibrio sp. HCB274 TaxID=3394361 RepID=UPI0039B5B271